MNKKELAQIGTVISAQFRDFKFTDNGTLPNELFNLWYGTFKHLPGEVVREAVKVHLMRSPFEPKIANIVEIIREANSVGLSSAQDAYGDLLKLVGRFGYHRQQKALESASPTLRKTIQRLGWKDICASTNAEALRAHFYRTYDAIKNSDSKRRELTKLTKQIRAVIGHAGGETKALPQEEAA